MYTKALNPVHGHRGAAHESTAHRVRLQQLPASPAARRPLSSSINAAAQQECQPCASSVQERAQQLASSLHVQACIEIGSVLVSVILT